MSFPSYALFFLVMEILEIQHILAWLNGEFYEESFTNAKKAQILLTTVDNSEDSEYFYEDEAVFAGCKPTGYHQGNDTQD